MKAACALASGAVERFREVSGGFVAIPSSRRSSVLLVVDDEELILGSLGRLLEMAWPGDVVTVLTLAEATDTLIAHHVTLALVDWKYPEGPPPLTLLTMLRERGIPTKVITGGDESAPHKEGVAKDDIMPKEDSSKILKWVREMAEAQGLF